jgi:hypothetical protein
MPIWLAASMRTTHPSPRTGFISFDKCNPHPPTIPPARRFHQQAFHADVHTPYRGRSHKSRNRKRGHENPIIPRTCTGAISYLLHSGVIIAAILPLRIWKSLRVFEWTARRSFLAKTRWLEWQANHPNVANSRPGSVTRQPCTARSAFDGVPPSPAEVRLGTSKCRAMCSAA